MNDQESMSWSEVADSTIYQDENGGELWKLDYAQICVGAESVSLS